MLRRNQKGQGLVEFALILPILIMLLIGIIEGARIIWAYITVQNAAREAARYAVTGRPFACSSDLVADPDPDNYCDDSVRGDPWSPQVLTSTRVVAIKDEAMKHGRNLNVKYAAVGDLKDFNDHRNTPGSFGVAVIGQDAANIGGIPNYAGQPGWNVRVETYYNIEIQAPIYDVILRGQVIHLSGQVELQNEGLDPSVQEYMGGITFQSDPCFPNCGGAVSTPYISVQDEGGDFTEPTSSNFTVSVNDHQPNTAYKLWLVWGIFSQSLDFTTDNLGGKLVNFVISASAPPSPGKDYKIYTTLAGDSTLVASCLNDLPTNAPCFRVTSGDARVEVRNINQGYEKQQLVPPDQARWPISSSIPIYLYSHTPNETYRMKFNGVDSSVAPGELWFDGSQSLYIPTDVLDGTNKNNEPGYYFAIGHTPGDLTIASENSGGTEVASTTLELIKATIDIAGETISSTHPADDNLYITLRDHAPRQQYQIFYDDGITPPAVVRAGEDGSVSANYVIPFGVHEPGTPPVPVEIYTLDYGRGSNPYRIASRTIIVETPVDPYINVPGGARWPAGSPIVIQLRRHKVNTEYGVYLQQGPAHSPTFSEQINGINYTTDTHPGDGLGYKDINYTIPLFYTGFYVIRSFETPDLTHPVASFDIEVMGNPYITIDNGHRWPPGSKITIRLKNHPSIPHDVWLDKGGAFETFFGAVEVNSNGEGVVQYTIPAAMPTRVDPDYYSIRSYLNGAVVAETGLEVTPADLIVSKIDVPKVILDVEVPITLTISNLNPVTVSNTYFDTDIYIVPPSHAPGNILLDDGLPPGDYKNWLDYVPPNGSVTVEDAIVVYGQQEHTIYGRVDTGNYVAEGGPPGEGNNLNNKIISGVCPSEIMDEFSDDGLAGWTKTGFGGVLTSTESVGVLIMTNQGSNALSGDDNGSNAGYHFMHQDAGGLSEVYVRVDQAPLNGSSGLAGLEIRSNHEDGRSAKIMFGYRSDNKLKIYRRTGGASQADSIKTQSNVNAPVWLKILRNGDEFKFFYVISSSDTPPTGWSLLHTESNVTMPDTVRVGLFNAPQSGSAAYQARFKHFHACAASGGSGGSGGGPVYLGNKCGQVEENGNGLVVIDAVNTIINNPSSSHSWQTVIVDNVLGEPSMEGLAANPDGGPALSDTSGPHATYQVNIESGGTYYVWVAGWGPDANGNAVFIGRQGSQVGDIDGFPINGSSPGWVKMPGAIDLAAAIHTIDLWMAEDGVRVFKVLLTKDAGFTPPPEGMSQSACTIISEPHLPPLLNQCTNVVRLGGFEGALAEVQAEWHPSGGANVGAPLSKYTGSYGANLAVQDGLQKPFIYQTFDLQAPSPGILADTTAILKLYKKVEAAGSHPNEQLRFALRRDSDGFTLVDVPVADGTSTQDWNLFSKNIFEGLNPLSFLEPGDKLRAYFYAPDPGFFTLFHIDDISLNFCSTQPEPAPVAGTGKVSGKTQNGSGAPLAGANVWAYAYADEQTGGGPGPVFKTYSLNDGTYRFYNLPVGSYMIYTEIQTAEGTKFDQRYVSVAADSEVTNVVLTIVAAKSG